jgi:thymidylate synthase ThyX
MTTDEERREIEQHMVEAVSAAGRAYQAIGKLLKIDQLTDFGLKKKLTSAMRRILPDGMATNIAVTANHRSWRHIIASRTSVHAEEEMRLAIGMVAKFMQEAYPNLYQDMHETSGGAWVFENDKV